MYVDELYKKLEESGYDNGLIKKSELHLSKYTDFSKQFEYMKNVDAQCLSSAKMDFNNAITKFNTEYDNKSYKKTSNKNIFSKLTIWKCFSFTKCIIINKLSGSSSKDLYCCFCIWLGSKCGYWHTTIIFYYV